VGDGDAKLKIKNKKPKTHMVTLTLLTYMPWISEITEAISASSAIGDRRERRGFGGMDAGAERGKNGCLADTVPLRLYDL